MLLLRNGESKKLPACEISMPALSCAGSDRRSRAGREVRATNSAKSGAAGLPWQAAADSSRPARITVSAEFTARATLYNAEPVMCTSFKYKTGAGNGIAPIAARNCISL